MAPEYKSNHLKLNGTLTLPKPMIRKIYFLLKEFDKHLEFQHSDDGSPVRYDIITVLKELELEASIAMLESEA